MFFNPEDIRWFSYRSGALPTDRVNRALHLAHEGNKGENGGFPWKYKGGPLGPLGAPCGPQAPTPEDRSSQGQNISLKFCFFDDFWFQIWTFGQCLV